MRVKLWSAGLRVVLDICGQRSSCASNAKKCGWKSLTLVAACAAGTRSVSRKTKKKLALPQAAEPQSQACEGCVRAALRT